MNRESGLEGEGPNNPSGINNNYPNTSLRPSLSGCRSPCRLRRLWLPSRLPGEGEDQLLAYWIRRSLLHYIVTTTLPIGRCMAVIMSGGNEHDETSPWALSAEMTVIARRRWPCCVGIYEWRGGWGDGLCGVACPSGRGGDDGCQCRTR